MTKDSNYKLPYKCLRCKDRNWLIECACGCGEIILLRYKNRVRIKRYIPGHVIRLRNQSRERNVNWKGGRHLSYGYWIIKMNGYYSSNKYGYIREHIYVYEQHYKCCMLPWGDVHHKNGIKDDNRIENLKAMMKRDHTKLHMKGMSHRKNKHIDFSDRVCHNCKSNKTKIRKACNDNRTPAPLWYHLPYDKINFYCDICYRKLRNLIN